MSKPTRILIVEDRAADADLARHVIHKLLADCDFQVVETRKDFLTALEVFQPDVILSDYSLPHFDGLQALKLALEHAPLTPFIIWTGSISEDVAVECMKTGANNYVLKENIQRLGPAVVHALEERELLMARRQAEEALQNSEKRFRALMENGSDNISLLRADGTLIWESPATVRMLRYAPDEFVGRNIFELMHPDDLEWARPMYARLIREPGDRQSGIFRLRHSDGTWRWAEAIATNLLNEPSVNAIVINYRDITERKQAEIELQQRNDDLALINALNEVINRGEGLDAVVDLMAKEIKRIFSGEGTTIYLLNPDGQSLQMQQYFLSPGILSKIEKLIGRTIPAIEIPIQEGGYFQSVLRSGRGVITSDPQAIQKWMEEFVETTFLPSAARGTIRKLIPQIYKLLNIRSTMLIPLVSDGKNIGLLDISSPNLFTGEDLKRVENIGGQLTTAIRRKQVEEALRQSQTKYQNLVETSHDLIWSVDAEARFTFVNGAAREVYGYEPEELLGRSFFEIMDPQHYHQDLKKFKETVAHVDELNGVETYVRHRDGRQLILSANSIVVRDADGKVVGVTGSSRDITVRKQVEKVLKEERNLLRTLIDNLPDRIYVMDKDGRKTLSNTADWQASGGKTMEDVIGKTDLETYPAALAQEFWRLNREVIDSGTPVINHEEPGFDVEGKPVSILSTKVPLKDSQGKIVGLVGIGRDITERKQDEARINDLLALNERILNSSPLGILTYKVTGECIFANEKAAQIVGTRVEQLRAQNFHTIESWKKSGLYGLVELSIESHSVVTADIHHYSTFGKDVWMTVHCVTFKSKDEEHVLLSVSDINERKRAEELLRQSEERFSSAFEYASIGMALVTSEGQWLRVNRALCNLIGYSEAELLEKTFQDITHPDDLQSDLNYVHQLLSGETNSYQMEKRYFHKSGRVVWVLLNVSLVRDNQGKPLYFISQIQDITERKLAEDALRLENERFLRFVESNIVGIVIADAAGNIVLTNDYYLNILGVTRQDFLAGKVDWRKFTPPEWLPADEKAIAELRARGVCEPYEKEYVRADGSRIPVYLADAMLPGAEEQIAAFVLDISERKRSELETRRHVAELEALYENGLAVSRLLEPGEIGNRVIETFARYLPWHHVTIRLRRGNTDELELVAFNLPNLKEADRAAAERHFVARINQVGQGLSGWVIQTGQPLCTGNVHVHPQYIDTHPGIQSGLYMPLRIGEHVIGVISVESEAPDAFTEQDERLLATLANQAAIAFENARLYETVQKELSERRRAEEALRSSEMHYRELADSITDILFELDRDLHYTHWNKTSEALTGILAGEAIGKSMFEIFEATEEQVRIKKIYEDVLRTRRPRTFETVTDIRGEKRSLEINAYPSTRGVSVVAKDVTERKRSESILQKRFELMEYSRSHTLGEVMQKITDEVSDLTRSTVGFFHFVEADQTTLGVQIWSTNALELCRLPLPESAHLPLNQAGAWAEAVRQRRPLIQNDCTSLFQTNDLPEGHVPVTREIVIPILRNERIVAVMGVADKPRDYTQDDLEIAERLADYAWDITERKQMEAALEDERNQLARRIQERTADLSHANAELARALRVKDEFLANMSHELRTPLNAILGLSESLGEQIAGPLNEKQQKYITTINESGHHLLSLINDILDLAKIESGQIVLDMDKVDVHVVCQASLRMIKQLAHKKNQEVTLTIDGDLGLIRADERRLKQMIVNLLGNAVKFTPENGRLGLEVHGHPNLDQITITVWDNGIGIRQEDLARLFQPFVQLDSGLARETTGTGLGLALVAQMARLHGGSVSAVSEPNVGSRFTIVLPWDPGLSEETVSRSRITGKFRAIKPSQTEQSTVLLVEDTPDVIMLIRDYLELAGYRVVVAVDGVEGIAQARLIHPDLILMDVQLPGMNGLQVTRELRSEEKFRYTPIVALTALAMPGDRERCLEAGMDEYISKPVNLRALVKIIQRCLFNDEESRLR